MVWIKFRIRFMHFWKLPIDISAGLIWYSVAGFLRFSFHQRKAVPKSHLIPAYSCLPDYTKNSKNTLENI